MINHGELNREGHLECFNCMATESFRTELLASLRARCPLLYITTNEEKRLLTLFRHLASAFGYKVYLWDCFVGLIDTVSGSIPEAFPGITNLGCDPLSILNALYDNVRELRQKAKSMFDSGCPGEIYILQDFYYFFDPLDYKPEIERGLKQISMIRSPCTIIVTGPKIVLTPSLESEFSVLDFPYPNDYELGEILDNLVNSVLRQAKDLKTDNGINTLQDELSNKRDKLIQAAHGLTLREAKMAISKSVAKDKTLSIQFILNEKKQIIKKKGYLEYFEPKVTMKDVGGLKNMINWFEERYLSLSLDGEKYGLGFPRGVILVGIPGAGKSLTCKAIASLYGMPLLRLDFGRIFQKLVGQSEEAIRESIKLAESLSPVLVWADEFEKGISGVMSSGLTDGGTTSRVMGTLLTWMQEREAKVFMICTCNDYRQIPPEMMRRFDECFFVDFPNSFERKQIFEILLRREKRDSNDYDLDRLANESNYFTGNEIEKSIKDAMFIGFKNNREFTDEDLIYALKKRIPIYHSRKEDLVGLREWANQNCIRANADIDEDGDGE